MDPFMVYMRLDKYTSRICKPLISRYSLNKKYYSCIFQGNSYKIYTIFPLQHLFGDIDLLEKNIMEKDIITLKQFVIIKSLNDQKLTRDWPLYFQLIELGDNESTIRDKKNALQYCINSHVDFLNSKIYSKELHSIDLEDLVPRLEFLLFLNIIMAREFS